MSPSNISYNDPKSVTRQFSNILKDENIRKEFNRWNDVTYVIEKNKQVYTNVSVENSKVLFTKEILDSIIKR